MQNKTKEKVAILGGGMAAMTAAFELTSTEERRDRYDVTVYQVGWRLGGKGASGRNRQHNDRIEEHGLHILLGFYENAFRILRECYQELGRSPDAPLATFADAFKPHNYVVIEDEVDGRWQPWPLDLPSLGAGKPGEDANIGSIVDYVKALGAWLWRRFKEYKNENHENDIAPTLDDDIEVLEEELALRRSGARGIGDDDEADILDQYVEGITDSSSRGFGDAFKGVTASLWVVAKRIVKPIGEAMMTHWVKYLERFRGWLEKQCNPPLSLLRRRLWITLDLGITAALGILKEKLELESKAWEALDEMDLRTWLRNHGASEMAIDSAPVRSLYNLTFSGPGQIAAGTSLLGTMRMLFGYKDAVFTKMQAGMGDTIFAPLYLVLKQRGVKFEFFHRVDELVLSTDKTHVAAIQMGCQVRPEGDEYEPLYDVKGLPCWPSEPLYERIENGEKLRNSGQNLESAWNTWPDVEKRTLEIGKDFDRVILGIAIGAFPHICKQLIAANEGFANMVEHVKTTQTQAVQLWFSRDLKQLGWNLDSPVLDGFADPFDTWADMSHLLPRERWPEENAPRNIAYLCSRLEDDEEPPAPWTGGDYPARQAARTKKNALRWLNESAHELWPGVAKNGEFDWSSLFDSPEREGVDRFNAQYWQATFCPSERYVLGVPGSTKYRLRAHESGFRNLVLAGDWVKTGLNAGCVESATMAGLQAARVICGFPKTIPGDDGLPALEQLPDLIERAILDGPRYVERSGEIVIRQPLQMTGVTLSMFGLDADKEKLRKLVNRHLNVPANGAVHYEPVASFVMLVCADMERAQAAEEPDRSKGWMGERDVAFWVPLWGGKKEGGVFVPDRLVFFLPYVFVDNIAATVTGRETYGFHKTIGTIRFPEDSPEQSTFSVDTSVIPKYGTDERAKNEVRLLEIEPCEAEPSGSIENVKQYLVNTCLAGLNNAVRDTAQGILHAVGGPEVRMVFLKQLRDVEDPRRACYQAIVEAPAVPTAFRGSHLLPQHRVRIEAVDSHPIVKDLGLQRLESTMAWRIEFDFVMEKGKTLWAASV